MNYNNVIWFQNSTPQSRPQITICKNGKISIGRAAQNILPEYVQFGFDSRARRLLIKGKTKKPASMSIPCQRKIPS